MAENPTGPLCAISSHSTTLTVAYPQHFLLNGDAYSYRRFSDCLVPEFVPQRRQSLRGQLIASDLFFWIARISVGVVGFAGHFQTSQKLDIALHSCNQSCDPGADREQPLINFRNARAFGSSRDLAPFKGDFRFCLVNGHHRPDGPCPKSAKTETHAPQQIASLFDHLVGSSKQ